MEPALHTINVFVIIEKKQRAVVFEAVWSHNAEKATEEMSRLLLRTISYHDYKEDFYHAFLAGIFSGAGYDVEEDCMRALAQIKEKGYAEEFKEDYTEVLCYGVACCKKRCLMKSS